MGSIKQPAAMKEEKLLRGTQLSLRSVGGGGGQKVRGDHFRGEAGLRICDIFA